MKQGLLGEKRGELVELEQELKDDLDSLLDASFVLNSPFDLDPARIESAAKRAAELIRKGNQLRDQIDQLEDELGL